MSERKQDGEPKSLPGFDHRLLTGGFGNFLPSGDERFSELSKHSAVQGRGRVRLICITKVLRVWEPLAEGRPQKTAAQGSRAQRQWQTTEKPSLPAPARPALQPAPAPSKQQHCSHSSDAKSLFLYEPWLVHRKGKSQITQTIEIQLLYPISFKCSEMLHRLLWIQIVADNVSFPTWNFSTFWGWQRHQLHWHCHNNSSFK